MSDVQQTLQGYGLTQARAAFLTAAIDTNDLAVSVGDSTGFEQGVAEIDNEIVFISSVDYSSNTLTLAPDGRGFYGTSVASHSTDARITMAPIWPKNKIASAINEAILGTYPTLFSIATTTFSFNPAINTYELPATCKSVLRVTADTIGPTKEQLRIARFSFNPTANGEFGSGKSLTLEKGAFPGRNINVTFKTVPAEITFGNNFTASGLAETAKLAIKYAACSSLLAFMDSSRLPVDTSQADELDESKNPVGSASKLSAQLYQRYLVELEKERQRLRETTPTPMTVRTR